MAIVSTMMPVATIGTVSYFATVIASLCATNAEKSHEFNSLMLLTAIEGCSIVIMHLS